MRRVFLMVAAVCGLFLIFHSFNFWQEIRQLKKSNLSATERIMEFQRESQQLQSLPDCPIEGLKEGYQRLYEQIRLFSRSHDFKSSFDIQGVNKEGSVSQAMSESSWPGIKRLLLEFNFYELKDVGETLMVLDFLKIVEKSNPIRIRNIIQTGDYLQVELDLYGEGI